MDKEIWDELNKLDEAHFSKQDLKNHSKHKAQLGVDSDEEYDYITHELTRHPALPIGDYNIKDIIGYINQDGRSIKFVEWRGQLYIFSAYRGDPETGIAITCYPKMIQDIYRKADPYNFYKFSSGQGDYRYKSDLDGKFEGLKFFDKHPEYHKNTSEENIKIIRDKILKNEKLANFNTNKE